MAIQITSDNFDEYFDQALIDRGADAINDDDTQGGIVEVTESNISEDFLMLLLDKTTGSEVWKKAKLEELAKKIDAVMSLVHNATLVTSLPAASAETMRRMYLVPAVLTSTALWDWANGVPSGLRDVVISGIDQSGTLPSNNDTYSIGIGPAEAGNDVSCRVTQSSNTFVTIGMGVAIKIPVAVAGDVVTVAFADNTAANCTFGGTALSGSTFNHTVTAAEATAGQITLVTTGTVKITSVGANYLAGNKAQGFDPQHTQFDKYITVEDTTTGTPVYRWEQIGSAYINMAKYYTKEEVLQLFDGIETRYLEEDNTYSGNNTHTGEDTWINSAQADMPTVSIDNSGVKATGRPQGESSERDFIEMTPTEINFKDNVGTEYLTREKVARMGEISGVVPSAASPLNQLADKNFVVDRIQTDTAEFQGTYNVVYDLGLVYNAPQELVTAKLNIAASSPNAVVSKIDPAKKLNELADNNDYILVQFPVSAGNPTEILRIERYKFNGTAWAFEFSLNSGGYTATIAIGTVTTLEPGQPATVTNSGTEGAAVFNFGIPKGAKGDNGEKGDKGDDLDYSTMTPEEKSELNDTIVQHIVNENILGPTYDEVDHGFNFPKAMHVQYDEVEHGFTI